MNFLQKINAVWQKVEPVQRVMLVAIFLTFIAAAGLLTYWVRRPDMRLLYMDLDPEEASRITEKINERGIAYELRGGGASIYVPREEVYQLRLDMAKEGLLAGSRSGYKIFDDQKVTISPFAETVNHKRALQDELVQSIQMIEGVVHARVHIVAPEQSIFASGQENTTASVVLRLRPGYQLSVFNIAAITHLVAGSVEGLKSESVTVVDSLGRLLSRESDQMMNNGAGTVQDYRERVEQNLSEKIEDMLTTVLGPGRATVKVSTVIDMNSTNIVTETYDKGVPLKEETKSESETGASSIPGEGEPAIPGSTKEGETTITEMAVGKTVRQEVVLPGKIVSLKVAAFVDLSNPAADPNDPSTANLMEVTQVEEIIQNALGLEDSSAIKVVNTRFNRPVEADVDEEEVKELNFVAIAGQASLGIMAVCALLVLKMFSGARKKAMVASAPASLPGGETAAGLLSAGRGQEEALVLRKQIAGALRSNPEHVKQLFTSWLEEKG